MAVDGQNGLPRRSQNWRIEMDFLRRKKARKRSPLKQGLLRLPGQSLQEEINRTVDQWIEYVLIMTVFAIIAGMEWFRWFFKSPPHPLPFTAMAAIVWCYGIWKLVQTRKRLKILKQGRDGERYVGQCLEGLRENGYRVLHDIVGDGFNIDHVLIGPTGVYTVDTKTISKPTKGECKIVYDRESVSINGFTPNRDPIVGAKAQADWIKKKFLKEAIPRDLPVRPVVLYPGWFVVEPNGSEVWVLNPDRFFGYVKNGKLVLDKRDIQAIEGCLSVYVRNSELT